MFRTRLPRVLAVAALTLLVVTCVDDRSPVAPFKGPQFSALPFSGPAVLVGAGDIAACTNNHDSLTANIIDGIPGTVFTAGDNAYPNGRAVDYQNCYEPTWGRFKARTYATLGNHEYDSSATADPTFDYFGTRAGPRGLGYYSFELGAWHIVVLNDNGQFVQFRSGSAQDQWLIADLAAHPNLCTLVIWHQPFRFSNKSLTGATSDPARKIFWDRLYAAGVDVAVNGHQHQYERFLPMNPDGVLDPERGIRSFIVGSGGESAFQPVLIAPNSAVQSGNFGVMKFTLKDGGYDWQFIPIAGQTFTDAGSASCHDAPGGVSGTASTIAAAPTPVMKGVPSTITVTAKDANGNPVAGAFVSLAATGAGNTVTQPSAYTDENGIATGTLSSTVTEVKTVSATVNGVALTQTASVVVTAPASASKSKIATADRFIAVGTGTATITVTVLDAGSKPVGGAVVTLQATGTGNTITQPTALTDATGKTTGTLSSTDAGVKTVSAIANGTLISPTASVTVTIPGASRSNVSASPTQFTAGTGQSTITVTVKDAGNHALSGAAVVLSATGTGNTITQPTLLTNANGVTTGILTSTDPGPKVVSATANGVLITKTVTVTANASPVSASLSTVAAAPNSIPVSGGASTITVTVKNGSGQPISGATVVLAATGTGNTLVQPSGVTNASGVATGTLSSTVAEVKTVSATANGVALSQSASVTVTSVDVSPSQSTLGASPTSISAGGGSSTITVTARDGSGNPISGATVVLAASGSGNTLTQPAGPTNASGVATGTLSSSVAELKTVSATINGTAITQTASVTVTAPVTISPSLSSIGAAPTPITAGAGSATITVTVRNTNGDPVSGATVVLASNGTQNTLTQPAATTDVNGVATGTLSSNKAELKTISATAEGVAITQTAQVTVTAGPLSGATSTVSAAPTSIAPGTETSTIFVTAKDGFGNPVSGATVVLSATGSGNTLTQPSATTNSVGVTSGSLSSTVEGSKTVSATANGVAITQTASVTVTAPPSGGAITHTLLTSGNDVLNTQVYTTASIAPAANALVTVAVATHRSTSPAPVPTLSGGGMSNWEVVATVTYDTIGLPLKQVTIYRAMSASPGSGPITITSSSTVSNCQWIVSQWTGVATSGTNGSGAIVQTATNAANADVALTVSLAAFANPANVAYGVFGINSNVVAINPGTGFTEIAEQPSTESTNADLFAEWAVNRPAVQANWAVTKKAGGIGVEIKAAP
ncbi:MAG TPA: invasin domain 3-containing protein [Gemmatimonadales bacterium]|nr:invasin domain 3-containing protein [Gemmatimonadales bacterium]